MKLFVTIEMAMRYGLKIFRGVSQLEEAMSHSGIDDLRFSIADFGLTASINNHQSTFRNCEGGIVFTAGMVGVHYWYARRSLLVCSAFTTGMLGVHCWYARRSLLVCSVFTAGMLGIHCWYARCSPLVCSVFTAGMLGVHRWYARRSPLVCSVFTVGVLGVHYGCARWGWWA